MSSESYLILSGGYEGKVETLAFNPSSNPPSLDIVASNTQCGIGPTWLVRSKDGNTIYAIDEWSEPSGLITALSLSPSGTLKSLSSIPSGGLWPCHGTLIPTSPPRLIVVHYRGALITSTPLLPNGDFDPDLSKRQVVDFKGVGLGKFGPVESRQKQNHPHGTHLSPDGGYVLVPDLGADELHVLKIETDGSLKIVDSIYLEAGDGPRHATFDVRASGETFLYILNELHNSVSVYSYSVTPTSPKPTLKPLQTRLSILPSSPHPHQKDFSTWHCAEILMSPDHTTLYCSNRAEGHDPLGGTHLGPADLIALIPVKSDGTLSTPKLVESGTRAPRNFSISNEGREGKGRYLAVGGHDSDDVVLFERKEGELKEVVRKRGVGRPGHLLWL